ncbi:MAG TPA: histidine phosphatase family protein [Kineosporiaceae bacterium]|nr:histidine phosphatase family protein [Kineosporiaceae bacterium]
MTSQPTAAPTAVPEHHATGDVGGDGENPRLWIVRHGPTEWSSSRRHTGRTDVPLTPAGEREAAALRGRLAGVRFGLVLTSPMVRARRTAELAGFPDAEIEPLAHEWDYGRYEGWTRAEVREEIPDWSPWTYPDMPGGERLDQVAERAAKVVARVRSSAVENALLFAHGHFLRMVVIQWIDASWTLAGRLTIDPAAISVLGWDRETAVLERFNS